MSAPAPESAPSGRHELLQIPTPGTVSVAKSKAATMDAAEDVVFGSVSIPFFEHFLTSLLTIPQLAGIAGKFIEYPFDTVKVRLQSQPDHLPLRYTGPLDCFRQSIRADGFLGLYRGISAPLVGAALDTGSLFFWERMAQKGLFVSGIYKPEEKLPLSALFFTGAVAGSFTSLVLTPIELVKCKMQVPATDGMVVQAPKPLDIIRTIYRRGGLLGFWHGQFGTLIRETGGSAAWFGSKESVTALFRNLNNKSQSHITASNELLPLPLWQQALAGAAAGVSYNFSTYPADTIKSRMQTASGPSQTFWKEGMSIWKQSGLRGFYRGCGITVVRSAPSSAFIFILYDAMKRQFHFA